MTTCLDLSQLMARKKICVGEAECDKDYISNLPDDILCYILSFMGTKYSVRTRILSKRWKHLFSMVPVLDFSCPSVKISSLLPVFRRYLNFINWVLNSYKVVKMERIHFSYNHQFLEPEETSLMFYWICEFIRRGGVREIDVSNVDFYVVTMPSCILTCQTLTFLKLNGAYGMEIPDNAFLPYLKTLSLSGALFVDSCSASRLLASCPVLEDLNLRCSTVSDNKAVYACIPTLKSLKMNHLFGDFELVLDIPNVEYLDFDYSVALRFSVVRELKLLQRVRIYLYRCRLQREDESFEKLVSMFCHSRHLRLCANTLKVFEMFRRPPVFHNLTRLQIIVCTHFRPEWVLGLLDKSPRLEALVFYNSHMDGYLIRPRGRWMIDDFPACVSLHLKEEKYMKFLTLQFQCKQVEYLVKKARGLDADKILFKCGLEIEHEWSMSNLPTFPRCSGPCQINLIEPYMVEC